MSIKSDLLAMADEIKRVGFNPHDVKDNLGRVCFVGARINLFGYGYGYDLLTTLDRALPSNNQYDSSSIEWAMNHNLTTEEAVEFIRKVAERL